MTLVVVAEWRPDSSGLNAQWVSELTNVLPVAEGVIPFKALKEITEALAARPLGGIAVRDSSGGVHVLVGTTDKLWKLNNSTLVWADVSKAMTTYTATENEPWRAKVYGNSVVFVNINDDAQEYVVGSSTLFADLAGSPPRARHIAVFNDMLGLASDDTLYWSDTDDIENWTPGGASNAGSQTFPDGGIIQGMTDSTNPFIFQRNAIRQATFQPGSAEIFTFVKLTDGRGCAAPYSICSRGDITFFADTGGFFQITPEGIEPIGYEKLDRTIFAALPSTQLARIFGAVDPIHTRVYFALNISGSPSAYDRLLIYDWNLKRWSMARFACELPIPLLSGMGGVSLDDLTDNIDTFGRSFDDKAFQAGAPFMACFDSSFRLGSFQGQNLEAKITVREAGDTAKTVMWIDNVRPIVDAAQCYMNSGKRMSLGKPVEWEPEVAINQETGLFDVLIETRFAQFQFRIPSGEVWTLFQGADIAESAAGER